VTSVTFRSLAEGDLPHLAGWLSAEHVQEWWRDASASDPVREKYLPRILGDEPTEVFVIVADADDIGFIQRYRLSSYPTWTNTVAGSGLTFPNGAGIDYVIGDPERVGRGIGSCAVARFTELVFADYADVDSIVVTPQSANRASCRVLEKAGYELRWTGALDSDDPSDAGPAALYVRQR
jgi:aminoglycoside 6'-N-acetyltransferase